MFVIGLIQDKFRRKIEQMLVSGVSRDALSNKMMYLRYEIMKKTLKMVTAYQQRGYGGHVKIRVTAYQQRGYGSGGVSKEAMAVVDCHTK